MSTIPLQFTISKECRKLAEKIADDIFATVSGEVTIAGSGNLLMLPSDPNAMIPGWGSAIVVPYRTGLGTLGYMTHNGDHVTEDEIPPYHLDFVRKAFNN